MSYSSAIMFVNVDLGEFICVWEFIRKYYIFICKKFQNLENISSPCITTYSTLPIIKKDNVY